MVSLHLIDSSKMTLERCLEKAPAVAQVVKHGGSWCKLWDTTLHLGTRHTTGFQALSKVLAHHGHACSLCDKNMFNSNVIAHLLSDHLDRLGLQSVASLSSVENLLTHMVNCKIDFVYKFGSSWIPLGILFCVSVLFGTALFPLRACAAGVKQSVVCLRRCCHKNRQFQRSRRWWEL